MLTEAKGNNSLISFLCFCDEPNTFTVKKNKAIITSGGSKGRMGGGARNAPSFGQDSFISMQYSAKMFSNNRLAPL